MESSIGCPSARIVAGLLASGFLAFSQIAPVTRASQDRIRDINRQVSVEGDAAAMNGLLKERARLLTELMERNPRAAVESALPDALRQDLVRRVPEAETLLEERGQWTGPLVTSVADDFAHHRSWTTRVIRVQGHAFRLFWDSPPGAGCSPSATVRGIRLGHRIAAASGEVTQDATSSCTTTGDQKTVVLLINYPSTALTSGYTTSYVNNIFFGPAPSVTDYWSEASYGTTSASGDVFGPFTLDADYTCDQQDAILQAAIQAADATVDFTAYQRIFLILPVTVAGGCAYDGMAQLGCSVQQSPSKGSFTASATWIESITIGPNIYGALGGLLQTAIHEGGHNFGLRHASSLDYDTLPAGLPGMDGTHSEYGDPFSSMGTNPGHFAAPHKNLLGWLSQGTGWLQVQSNGTWTLAPLSAQTSGSPQALRVQRGSGNDQWLWVEYRQPIGSYEPSILDNGAPRDFNGALIHLEDPSQSSWTGYTELLDFQPVRLPNNFNTANLEAGTTWSDPYSDLTLTAGSTTPSGLTVTVSYDNGCATLSSGSQSYGPFAGTGQISVSAPPTCSWTAVSAAEWITFPGTQSGTGPGIVSYSVTPNSSTAARTSIISISHQTFTVTQAAQPQGGSVSVTPSSGTGANQTFSFVFSDATAWTNLTWGEININAAQITSNACYIHWVAAGNLLYLRDDGDDAWLGPVPVGGTTTLGNSQCVLSPGSASITGAGASATLSLTVNFTNRFAGSTKNVYMQAQSVSTAVGWQQAGTWTVTFPFSPVSVSPSSGSGYTQVFTFTMAGVYSGDEINLSFSTSTAFGTLQFYDHGCALVYGAVPSGLFLFSDLASSFTGTSGTVGAGPALRNSQCSINVAASSAVLSGSTLTLQLPITFTPAFLGQKNVYVFGPGTGWPTGAPYTPVGTFTVTAPPPAASVTLSPVNVAFNTQAVGTTSAAQTVTLTNTGNAALTITNIAIAGNSPSSFNQNSACGSTLNAGASCNISVTFQPASLGSQSAALTITDNAAGSPNTVTLSGTGSGTPVASLNTSVLAFSPQTVGTSSAAQTVTLKNTGTATLTIASVAITGANASQFGDTSGCGGSLNAGASCNISVTFQPTSLGSQSAALTITDNAAGSPHTVTLSGTGSGTPVASLNTSVLAFSPQTVGTSSAAQTVTLKNTGTAALTIASVAITGANASQFGDTSGCGGSLNAGASCNISVTFQPTSLGSHSAALTITDNAAGSPQSVSLSGTAAQPTVSLSPTSLTFASRAVGTSSAAQTVTLTNTSTVTLSIREIALAGASASQFAETSTCGGSLNAGASCTISVAFRPTLAGGQNASLAVTDNAAGSPQSVSLRGTALQPTVSLSRATLIFASQAVKTSSAAQSVTLTNTSTLTLTIANVALTGANANQFTEKSACGGSLNAGTSCTISVSFSPTSAGSKSASLTITDNAAGGSQSVALTGTGH
jgi:M6 family metalloprotease-like protein